MFKIGDVIVYGTQGICKIDCIESKLIGKQLADYYVLKPIFNQNTAFFVPVENDLLTAKMQNVLTKSQAKELIEKASQIDVINFADQTQKHEQYKTMLASGEREKLIALIKTIRIDKDARRECGKKLNLIDEQTLRKAELLLYNELAFVLGVEPQAIEGIIKF